MNNNAEILAAANLTKTVEAEAGDLGEANEPEGVRFAIDTPLGSFVIEVLPRT